MRRMLSAALLALTCLVTTATVLLVPTTSAYACSCKEPTMTERIPEAAVVVTGRVTAVTDPGGTSSDRPVDYTFAVDTVLKGDVGASVDVTSPAEGPSCGLELEQGAAYLVLAREDGGGLSTNLCSGTQPLTPAVLAEAEAVTGPGTTNPPPTPTDPPPVAAPTIAPVEVDPGVGWETYAVAATGLLLLAAGGWLVVRKRGQD